jgi:hypothetical protein
MGTSATLIGRQPYAPAAFTPGEIPGTHFQRLSRSQGTWFFQKEPWKKSPVTPLGIDPVTVRLVAQHLNHYATPGPNQLHAPQIYLRSQPFLGWSRNSPRLKKYEFSLPCYQNPIICTYPEPDKSSPCPCILFL